MDYTIPFLFSLALLYHAWFYLWRRVNLEDAIDKLFDLRDETREIFAKNNALDSKAYATLRSLLNGHIKFIDEVTLFFLIYFNIRTKNKENVLDDIDDQMDINLNTDNPVLNEHINRIRNESITILFNYLKQVSISMIVFNAIISLANKVFRDRSKERAKIFVIKNENIEKLSYSEDWGDRFNDRPIPAAG